MQETHNLYNMQKFKAVLTYAGIILAFTVAAFGILCLAAYVVMLLCNLLLGAVGATFMVKFWPMVGILTLAAIITFCYFYFRTDAKHFCLRFKRQEETKAEEVKRKLRQ